VCRDAAGQALEWDAESRRPKLVEDKCLSCMLCTFVCPVSDLISYKEMPRDWKRRETEIMNENLEKDIRLTPFTMEGPDECAV
jgi:dihydropyrimidine dehydrogenase (NAD+) subunit PreA